MNAPTGSSPKTLDRGRATSPALGTAPLRFASFWNLLGVGFVLLVIYLSLTPAPPDFDLPDALDVGHIIAYFWLMIWFAQMHRDARRRLLLATAFGTLGVTLEFIQGMTGYRQFDYLDMARNFLGIGIGLVLARSPLQNALQRFERLLARR